MYHDQLISKDANKGLYLRYVEAIESVFICVNYLRTPTQNILVFYHILLFVYVF